MTTIRSPTFNIRGVDSSKICRDPLRIRTTIRCRVMTASFVDARLVAIAATTVSDSASRSARKSRPYARPSFCVRAISAASHQPVNLSGVSILCTASMMPHSAQRGLPRALPGSSAAAAGAATGARRSPSRSDARVTASTRAPVAAGPPAVAPFGRAQVRAATAATEASTATPTYRARAGSRSRSVPNGLFTCLLAWSMSRMCPATTIASAGADVGTVSHSASASEVLCGAAKVIRFQGPAQPSEFQEASCPRRLAQRHERSTGREQAHERGSTLAITPTRAPAAARRGDPRRRGTLSGENQKPCGGPPARHRRGVPRRSRTGRS